MVNKGRKRRLATFFSLFEAVLKFLFRLPKGFKKKPNRFLFFEIDRHFYLLPVTGCSYKNNRLIFREF